MGAHKIYQIYYDAASQSSLDGGFIGLDNASNPRPDWYEYWPIRNFLLNTPLEDDTYYGFFSPKFGAKTSLTAADVHATLDAYPTDVDIVSFSPFFEHMAFPFNPFEQSSFFHTDSYPILVDAFKFLAPTYELGRPVMSSKDSIYSNYFAAKKSFWLAWFECCERIFQEVESGSSLLAKQLANDTDYAGKSCHLKIFVIERVASFLLLTNKKWRVKSHNPINSPQWAWDMVTKHELLQMDALKRAYADTGFIEYLEEYCVIRNAIALRSHPTGPD